MALATVLFALSTFLTSVNLIALRLYMGGRHEIESGTSVDTYMSISIIDERDFLIA